MRPFDLDGISRYRDSLMGIAILLVMLFHIGTPPTDAFYGLRRLGNVGVDIFLFLSGMGLWFAWCRNNSFRTFYRHRLRRIYPVWLVVAFIYYCRCYFIDGKDEGGLTDLIGDITLNWDFWLNGELTFWYVPAIAALYLVAPLYMELIRRQPVYRWLPAMLMLWCCVVEWVTPIHEALFHLEIFWSRLPIFFIGINMGESIRRKETVDGHALWLLLLCFTASLATCIYLEQVRHWHYPLFVCRMLYIPLTVSALLLLTHIADLMPACTLTHGIHRMLAFTGSLSLEIYLLHAQFVLIYVRPLELGYWPTFLLMLSICLPAAWLLRRIINVVVH